MDEPQKVIPSLRRKLRLLRDHHHFASLGEIAEAIGTKTKTLENWADSGSDLKTPGLVPADKFDDLVLIFASAIAKRHDISNVTEFLKSKDVATLDRLLQTQHLSDLLDIAGREGMRDSATIFTSDGRLSLVKKSGASAPQPDYDLKLGEAFRIEFQNALQSAHIIALQKTAQNWGYVPYLLNAKSLTIHLPDNDDNGLPDFISEDDEVGVSRFFVLQTSKPPPANIKTAIKLELNPDVIQLGEIASWYNSETINTRRIFEVRIEFSA